MGNKKEPIPVWEYHGPGRVYGWPPMQVTDGDRLQWPELPVADGCWAPAEPGAEPTLGPDLPGPHRIWSEEELTHGPVPALREHWEETDTEAAEAHPQETTPAEVSVDA